MANLEKECLFGNLSLGFGAKNEWPNEKRLFLIFMTKPAGPPHHGHQVESCLPLSNWRVPYLKILPVALSQQVLLALMLSRGPCNSIVMRPAGTYCTSYSTFKSLHFPFTLPFPIPSHPITP